MKDELRRPMMPLVPAVKQNWHRCPTQLTCGAANKTLWKMNLNQSSCVCPRIEGLLIVLSAYDGAHVSTAGN